MIITLDTNAYSALFRSNQKVMEIMESADEIIVPVTVAGELISGFYQGSKKDYNMEQFHFFMNQPGIRIQDTNLTIAERYGWLVTALRKAGTPLPTNDIWIAATSLSLGTPLLTGDAHFEKISGLQLISLFAK